MSKIGDYLLVMALLFIAGGKLFLALSYWHESREAKTARWNDE